MVRILTTLLAIFFSLQVYAQREQVSLWIPPFKYDTTKANFEKFATKYQDEVKKAFLSKKLFLLVERERREELEAELETQKSESFMDGKYVEQGKSIGAEYILFGDLDSEGFVNLVFVDCATGNKTQSERCDLSGNIKWGDSNVATKASWKKINKTVDIMVDAWLSEYKFSVVRALETKGEEAKLLLIAVGSSKNIQKKDNLEIFHIEKEIKEEEEFERYVEVGKLKITKVENSNFSQAKVEAGQKEIFELLHKKTKLYCRKIK